MCRVVEDRFHSSSLRFGKKTNSWLTVVDPPTKWWRPGRPPFFGTRHPRCHGVPTEGPEKEGGEVVVVGGGGVLGTV